MRNADGVSTTRPLPASATAQHAQPAKLGVVVIGRNEAPRIAACLRSVKRQAELVVYVDSGSSDGSPEIAESARITVIRLEDGPFTAARGRQVGYEALRKRCPRLEYVQFVDGDCILDAEWVDRAVEFLQSRPDVAVAVGRLRERRGAESLLIRLVDIDWDLPTGEVDAIGGIAMMRVEALQEVGGWQVHMIAGEELDLGARLRAQSWKLFRLEADMTLHDIGIQKLDEIWRRSIRSGYAYAELASRHGWRCRRWLRRCVGNMFYGLVLPIALVVCSFVFWPGCAVIAALYLLLVCRVGLHRLRRGDRAGLAALYAALLVMLKIGAAIGTLKFLGFRLVGRSGRLIEYKSAPSSTG